MDSLAVHLREKKMLPDSVAVSTCLKSRVYVLGCEPLFPFTPTAGVVVLARYKLASLMELYRYSELVCVGTEHVAH